MKLSEPLTEEQVHALPEGRLVVVTWSGGNGPHVYHTWKDKWGKTLLGELPGTRPGMDYKHSVGYVGPQPLTEIRTILEC